MLCAAAELGSGVELILWMTSHWDTARSMGIALLIFGTVNFVTTMFTVYVKDRKTGE